MASGHGIGKSAEMGMLSNVATSCFTYAKLVIPAITYGQLSVSAAA